MFSLSSLARFKNETNLHQLITPKLKKTEQPCFCLIDICFRLFLCYLCFLFVVAREDSECKDYQCHRGWHKYEPFTVNPKMMILVLGSWILNNIFNSILNRVFLEIPYSSVSSHGERNETHWFDIYGSLYKCS